MLLEIRLIGPFKLCYVHNFTTSFIFDRSALKLLKGKEETRKHRDIKEVSGNSTKEDCNEFK